MSNWTKGPLAVSKPDSIGTVVTGPRGVSVAWCGCGSVYDSDGSYSISQAEAHANAKLYAAAPELVEALVEMLDMSNRLAIALEIGDSRPHPQRPHYVAAVAKARSALAKAGA